MAGITTFELRKDFDLIACISTLHLLHEDEIRGIVEMMKKHTRGGGFNVITAFTVDDPGYQRHPEKFYYFDNEELKSIYSDWKIIEYDESVIEPEKHGKDGKIHRHGVASLIAKRTIS